MIRNLYLNAGQMKAGTTFLYRMLRNHPSIHFTPEKELHFLSQHLGRIRLLSEPVRRRKAMSLLAAAEKEGVALPELQRLMRWVADYIEQPSGWDWYERVFSGMEGEQYAADFSNLTCTIPVEGLVEIGRRFKSVKVTYCVRDPVERAYSHMKFHLRFAGSSAVLAEMSWDAVRELLLSDNIALQAQTARHLANLRAAFGDDNLRIIECEAMWKDPGACVDAVCHFLGLSEIDVPEADRRPANVGPAQPGSDAVMAWIEELLADEIASTKAALVEHAALLLVDHEPASTNLPSSLHSGPNDFTRP